MSDETIVAVLAQLENETPHDRIRLLQAILTAEIAMLNHGEVATELIRIRFALMRVNGVLQSERRPNHALEVAQKLITDQISVYAPEAE